MKQVAIKYEKEYHFQYISNGIGENRIENSYDMI